MLAQREYLLDAVELHPSVLGTRQVQVGFRLFRHKQDLARGSAVAPGHGCFRRIPHLFPNAYPLDLKQDFGK